MVSVAGKWGLPGLVLSAVSVNAAPVQYTIETLGLTDAEHTNSVGGRRESRVAAVHPSGAVSGTSTRYSSTGSELGTSAWYYDGVNTTNVGFRDAEYTRPTDNFRSSSPTGLVDPSIPSRFLGFSARYDSSGTQLGGSAWVTDGTATREIGLTDSQHTRPTDGLRSNLLVRARDGLVLGRANRYSATGDSNGFSTWVYDGSSTVRLGLADADHTRPDDGYQGTEFWDFNSRGTIVGRSTRYIGPSDSDLSSAWRYSGGVTQRIGLFDSTHTRSTDGAQSSSVRGLSRNDVAIGTSSRYGAAGESLGSSAWRNANGVTTPIAFAGSEFTRSTDGFQQYGVRGVTDNGNVAGVATRFAPDGSSLGQVAWFFDGNEIRDISLRGLFYADANGRSGSDVVAVSPEGKIAGEASYFNPFGGSNNALGRDAWYFNGEETRVIGLLDGDHQLGFMRDNFVSSITDDGFALGRARRYGTGSNRDAGWSAWVSDGEETVRLGLFDEDHTRGTNFQFTFVTVTTNDGFLAGTSNRYSAAGFLGRTAWLYNGEDIVAMDALGFSSTGRGDSAIAFVTEDGMAFGTYTEYSDTDELLGNHAFLYTREFGQLDLGSLAGESLENSDWLRLSSVTSIDENGNIYGNGYKLDLSPAAFRLTAVPVPPAIWLFGSGIGALLTYRKRMPPVRVNSTILPIRRPS